MSQKNFSMDDDDIAFAIGRIIIDNNLTRPEDLLNVVETGLKMRSYTGCHNRLFCVCSTAFSRGYFFLEERQQVRDLLDEMDSLPDQSDFRMNAPRVPSTPTRGGGAPVPKEAAIEAAPVVEESFPPVMFSRESA